MCTDNARSRNVANQDSAAHSYARECEEVALLSLVQLHALDIFLVLKVLVLSLMQSISRKSTQRLLTLFQNTTMLLFYDLMM